jgi:hypothetical protein
MSFEQYRFRNPEDLKAAGYSQLAGPYYRKDVSMLDNVLADAKAANKSVAFVGDNTHVEVWQRSNNPA